MFRYLLSIFLVLMELTGFVVAEAPIPAKSEKPIQVRWLFTAMDAAGEEVALPTRSRVELSSGNALRFMIIADRPCWFYLVMEEAEGGVELLHPQDLDQGKELSSELHLPGQGNWFILEGKNVTERFHILVSSQRLKEFEGLLRQVAVSKDEKSRQSLLDEIVRLRTQNSAMSSVAEKPPALAGVSRGIKEDIMKQMLTVEADEVYVKTVRFEH